MKVKTFISHSSKDKQFARRLAIDLEQSGIDVWFDEWELRIGDSLIEKIQKGVEESDFILVILSPNSINSKWVQEEIKSSILGGIEGEEVTLLPILYKDCKIFPFLRDKIYADFREDYITGLHSLIKRIKTDEPSLPKELIKRVENRLALTNNDLRVLKKMVDEGLVIDQEASLYILSQALVKRTYFSFWYEVAQQFNSIQDLRQLIQDIFPTKSPLFFRALEIATCEDLYEACEKLYKDLGIKSITKDGHLPFRNLHIYMDFFSLLDWVARIPTPIVVEIFNFDIFATYSKFCTWFTRHAVLTNEPEILDTLLDHVFSSTEEIIREDILLVLSEQVDDEILTELLIDKFNQVNEESHVRHRLIQKVNLLPQRVRLQLILLCWNDDYKDIREYARKSLFSYEKPLFKKMGLEV